MDDLTNKRQEDVERTKRLMSNTAVGDFGKLQEWAATTELQRLLAAIEKTDQATISAIPYRDPVRVMKGPTAEDTNQFQSAGALLRRLADAVSQWRAALPQDFQPAVIALLGGGVQISVDRLAQESFHGIRVEGRIQGTPCVVLAHQATIQLLCIAEPIQPPERPKRPIGFIIDGQSSEA